MNSFDHMVLLLNNAEAGVENYGIKVPTNPDKIKITQEEFDNFYKEFIFQKLKGKSLASAFAETFKVTSVIFTIKFSDEFALDFIKTHYIK